MPKIDPAHLKVVRKIIEETAPECETRAFGSRVDGNPKKYSDLDIVLVGSQKIDPRRLRKIKEAFAESDIPFRVDILDWNALSPQFQSAIAKSLEKI